MRAQAHLEFYMLLHECQHNSCIIHELLDCITVVLRVYYNLTQLQSMRCYGKIALRVAAILHAAARSAGLPIHTASKCRMPWPTSSASVVGMAASKLRRCTLFMPSAAPVRLAVPMQVGYRCGVLVEILTIRRPKLLRMNQPHVHPALQLRSKHPKQRHHLPPLLHIHVLNIRRPNPQLPLHPNHPLHYLPVVKLI